MVWFVHYVELHGTKKILLSCSLHTCVFFSTEYQGHINIQVFAYGALYGRPDFDQRKFSKIKFSLFFYVRYVYITPYKIFIFYHVLFIK